MVPHASSLSCLLACLAWLSPMCWVSPRVSSARYDAAGYRSATVQTGRKLRTVSLQSSPLTGLGALIIKFWGRQVPSVVAVRARSSIPVGLELRRGTGPFTLSRLAPPPSIPPGRAEISAIARRCKDQGPRLPSRHHWTAVRISGSSF